MHIKYNRRKPRLLVITLTLLLLWSQIGLLASPVRAEVAEPEAAEPEAVPQSVYAYKDITPEQPNYIFVNFLKHTGLVSGFPDGTFRPLAGLTRAEAATVLVKAAGLKTETTETGFKDISTQHWAAKNVAAAKKAGLITGYPNGTFRPDALLTRAEGITLILKLSKHADSAVDLPTIADVTSKHWAARAIATGLASEMVSLASDNKRFLPNTKFDRGSLARALAILLTKDPELNQTALSNNLTVTSGTVNITRAGKTVSESINSTAKLNVGDSLTVNQGSTAELAFPDGTGLRLEQNSWITLKESKGRSYIKADGRPGIAVELLNVELKRGKLFGALATTAQAQETSAEAASTKVWAASARVRATGMEGSKGITIAAAANPLPWWKQSGVKRTKVKVDMPTGVAAIRGTFWANTVSESGSSETNLLTGDAEVTSASGQNVSLTAGQRTEVTTATAPPAPPAPLTVTDQQEWVQAAEWAIEQAVVIAVNQEKPIPPPPPADKPQAAPPPVAPPPKPQTPAPLQPVPQQPKPVVPPITNITEIISRALVNAGAPPEIIEKAVKKATPVPIPIPIPIPVPVPVPVIVPPPVIDNGGSSSSDVSVTGITLNHSSLSLVVGQDPVTVTATVSPSDASSPTVTWADSKPTVASLVYGTSNREVKVKPLSTGTTTITVRASNGLTATCTVTVVPYVPVSFLSLNTSAIDLVVGGSPYILVPLTGPSNATNKAVTWISDNPGVASVVNGVVVPLSPGTATIKVKSEEDASKEASCVVYVTDNNYY